MIKTYVSNNGFVFKRDNRKKDIIGVAAYATLKLQTMGATKDEVHHMEIEMESYYPGEIYKRPAGIAPVVLGDPATPYTHQVILHGVGNPDHEQYGWFAPKKIVNVTGIEAAKEFMSKYQEYYTMGGGNCSPQHGVIWELKAGGKKKKVGRIYYNGKYETLAETKKWEAEIKTKYALK